MTGLELLAGLRRIAPALPVAVVTAHAPAGEAALLGGADAYLEKPVGIDQLISTAAALCSHGRPAGEAGSDRDNLRTWRPVQR